MFKVKINEKGQAMPLKTVPIDFCKQDEHDQTVLYWLGMAGIMIKSHGCCVMIDPLLEGFDMPLLIDFPMTCQDVDHLDGVLITHIDQDHFSQATCSSLMKKCEDFYAPNYVAEVMKEKGYPVHLCHIGETFSCHNLSVTPTKVWHNWQNEQPKWQYRHWEEKDYCGYWLESQDGTIWLPGDSRLLEEHLHMPSPNVILLDFSDNEWHITLQGAIRLANAYPHAQLICIHWGSVDAPHATAFNANPCDLMSSIVNPSRLHVMFPGEPYVLNKENAL